MYMNPLTKSCSEYSKQMISVQKHVCWYGQHLQVNLLVGFGYTFSTCRFWPHLFYSKRVFARISFVLSAIEGLISAVAKNELVYNIMLVRGVSPN